MARTHARIYASIWADKDFIGRSELAQRMFLFLVSQPDVEHSGVMGLRERRWTRGSVESTIERVRAALAELITHRFVVVDEDTEELLLRSFMRWDGVWRQPNVAKSAADHIRSLTSVPIRAALRTELLRIEINGSNMKPHVFAEVKQLREDLLDELAEAITDPAANPSGKGSGNPSRKGYANGSGNPSAKGSGEGVGNGNSKGLPPSPAPSTSTSPAIPPPAGADKPRRTEAGGANVSDVVAAFIEGAQDSGQPRPASSIIGRVGSQARTLIADGFTVDTLITSARRMGAGEWNDLAVQLRKDAAGRTSNGNRSREQQQTDDMFDRAMARAQEREAAGR